MSDRTGHDSRAVANKILELASERGIELTIMQLLKLVFFSHGWHLARCGEPLTKDSAEAWQYGPVYPLVYRGAPRVGAQVSGAVADFRSKIPIVDDFSPEEVETMTAVVEGYGPMHAFRLSQLTHEDGSPWHRAYKELGVYSDIPDDWIAAYFKAKQAA
jgi:uncharacterized phage-associated protein